MKPQIMFALAAFAAAQAFAVSPVVVWDGAAGDFAALTKNGYMLNLNDQNTAAEDGSAVTIGEGNQKKAVVLTGEAAGAFGTAGALTVIAQFDSIPLVTPYRAIFALMDGGSYQNGDNGLKLGVLSNGKAGYGIWEGQIRNTGGAGVFSSSAHMIAMSYSSTGGTKTYVDGTLKIDDTGLKSKDFLAPTGIAIGGVDTDGSTKFYAQTGMVVKAVAVFTSVLSAEEIAAFKFHLTQDDLTAGEDNTITLDRDITMFVESDITIGKLTVTGPYTLTLAGAGAITASSLAVENGATVALADGTTLDDGRIETDAVSGSGTVKYSGVAPDALECWDDSSVWTGTVWIVGKETLALNEWDPSALGSEASTLRLSGVKGYFKSGVTVDVPVELDNDAYGYGLDLNNGWGNGAAVNTIATLKGSGTFKTESKGKNEVVRIVDASAFTGAMNLAQKIIIIGDRDGTLAATYRAKQNSNTSYPGEGALVIADDGVLNWNSATSLSYTKITSETTNATIKVAAPWDLTPTLGTGVADAATWQGVVELAAMANDSSASIAFHANRMGNASSLAVVKGLTKGTNGKGFHLGSTACGGRNFRLDGDLDICNGSSNTTYSFGVLSGTGNFTVDTNFAGGPSGVVFNLAVKDYTGALTAVKPNDSIAVTVYCDALPDVGASILKLGAAPQTNAVEIAAVVAGGRTRTDLTYRVLERDGAWSFTRTGGYYIRLR